MKLRTIIGALACGFALLLLQFIIALLNPQAGVVCGAVVAIFSLLLLRFFQIELREIWLTALLPTVSSAAGVALDFFARDGQPLTLWLAPLLACGLTLVIVGIESLRSKRCGLCNRRLSDDVAFVCPRCDLLVCDRTCWVFEHSRCRLCEQNHVPIFPPDAKWWDKQLGPRTLQGRCQLCLVLAEEADLRACRNCGRPQCRDCWDAANGQCGRCQWTMEEIPESLRPYVVEHAEHYG